MRRTQRDSRDGRLRPQRGAAPVAARAKSTDDPGNGRRRRTAGNRDEDRYFARGPDVVRGVAAIPTSASLAPHRTACHPEPLAPLVILTKRKGSRTASSIACHRDEASHASLLVILTKRATRADGRISDSFASAKPV